MIQIMNWFWCPDCHTLAWVAKSTDDNIPSCHDCEKDSRKDGQRDFVIILFEVFDDHSSDDDENDAWLCRYLTSSAKYSEQFAKNMNSIHSPCQKVSDVFGVI